MKNLLKISLLSVALLSSVVAFSSNKINIKIASKAAKVLMLTIDEVTSGETINIRDYEGEILFSDTIKDSGIYFKTLSVYELPTGMYFIENITDEKISVTPIMVNEKEVKLMKAYEETYLAPEITLEGDTLKVLVSNDSNALVSISVYDNNGTLLNKAETYNNKLILGSYDVSELPYDSLIISVAKGDYSFVKELDI